jgi:hypothetical protein
LIVSHLIFVPAERDRPRELEPHRVLHPPQGPDRLRRRQCHGRQTLDSPMQVRAASLILKGCQDFILLIFLLSTDSIKKFLTNEALPFPGF